MVASLGAWVLAAASALGLADAIVAFFNRGSGIDHTAGALLVIVSTAILLVLGLILTRPWRLHGVLAVLAILDILGTGLAAYFLHAWLLLALMAVAALAWLVLLLAPGRRPREA